MKARVHIRWAVDRGWYLGEEYVDGVATRRFFELARRPAGWSVVMERRGHRTFIAVGVGHAGDAKQIALDYARVLLSRRERRASR